MKSILLSFLFLVFGFSLKSQTLATSEVTLFGQCMIELEDQNEATTLETEMRNNPNIKIVRLDYNSQRAFILTKDIDQLTEEQFTSWFMEYDSKVRCIQVGRYGIDAIKPFPFEGCEK
jgi:hypothetical protein